MNLRRRPATIEMAHNLTVTATPVKPLRADHTTEHPAQPGTH